MLTLNAILLFCFLSLSHPKSGFCQRNTWNYTILSTTSYTTNPDAFDWKSDVIRITRTEFAVSGYTWVGKTPDKNTKVAAEFFRSRTGSQDYVRMPLGLSRCTFQSFMDNFYSKYIMKDVIDCSTGPQYFGRFSMPFETGLYLFNNCILSTKLFPQILPGYYKLIFTIDDPEVKTVVSFKIQVANEWL